MQNITIILHSRLAPWGWTLAGKDHPQFSILFDVCHNFLNSTFSHPVTPTPVSLPNFLIVIPRKPRNQTQMW